MKAVTPLRWPADLEELVAQPRLLIATVDTPSTAKRDFARRRVRAALGDLLARRLGVPRETIRFVAQPGQPIRLAPPYAQIGLSVSHEAGLSLLAIDLAGPVGIDLLLPSELASDEIRRLANDYLGPASTQRIAARPVAERAGAFASAWTAHEAALKCLGLPLGEWQPEIGRHLARCRLTPLRLAAPYLGMLAELPPATAAGSPVV